MAFIKQHYLTSNVISSLKPIDYSQWQRENEVKKQKPSKGLLSSVASAESVRIRSKSPLPRSKEAKPSGEKRTSSHVKIVPSTKQRASAASAAAAARASGVAKSLENIKILQKLSKSKINSLDELKHHSTVLLGKNVQLMENIKEMDFEMVKEARELLQQYDMFGATIANLQDSSQNQVGVAKAELLATEKMMEKRMGKLEQERKIMNSKVQSVQDELNILRTYMDKEFPVRAVQIANLLRAIRSLSEEQQYELEDIEDLSKRFLETLAEKEQQEEERILQAVAEKKLSRYKVGLNQMNRNNLGLRTQIAAQKQIINEMLKEIKVLQKKVMELHDDIRDPREVIFPDILLRRPKCHPDMEVVLNIPTEGDFPL